MSPLDIDRFAIANQVFGIGGGIGMAKQEDFAMANVKSKLPLKCLKPEDVGVYTCIAEMRKSNSSQPLWYQLTTVRASIPKSNQAG